MLLHPKRRFLTLSMFAGCALIVTVTTAAENDAQEGFFRLKLGSGAPVLLAVGENAVRIVGQDGVTAPPVADRQDKFPLPVSAGDGLTAAHLENVRCAVKTSGSRSVSSTRGRRRSPAFRADLVLVRTDAGGRQWSAHTRISSGVALTSSGNVPLVDVSASAAPLTAKLEVSDRGALGLGVRLKVGTFSVSRVRMDGREATLTARVVDRDGTEVFRKTGGLSAFGFG